MMSSCVASVDAPPARFRPGGNLVQVTMMSRPRLIQRPLDFAPTPGQAQAASVLPQPMQRRFVRAPEGDRRLARGGTGRPRGGAASNSRSA
jgi:hypothetical protein